MSLTGSDLSAVRGHLRRWKTLLCKTLARAVGPHLARIPD